jgi:uncharacterized protein (TIGR03437 family)
MSAGGILIRIGEKMFRNRTMATLLYFALLFGVPRLWAQTASFSTVSAANYGSIVAPDSIATGMGMNLASVTAPSTGLPLPTSLGGDQVSVADSAGKSATVSLYLVAPTQINYVIPAGAALGKGTAQVSGSTNVQGPVLISNVAPGIWTANQNGTGVPVGQVVYVSASGTQTVQTLFKSGSSGFVTNPVDVSGSSGAAYLVLYGTGVRRHSLNPVKAAIGGTSVTVPYAGVQPSYPGLDQINIGPLPSSLAGKGDISLILTVDGVPANAVTIGIQ